MKKLPMFNLAGSPFGKPFVMYIDSSFYIKVHDERKQQGPESWVLGLGANDSAYTVFERHYGHLRTP